MSELDNNSLPGDFAYHPGQIVDGLYQLISVIGEGGMGLVFKAQHILLDQTCAIKIVPRANVTDEELKRFEVEVKSLAKLEHPGIVRVYNMGRDKGLYPYYAMELLDGQSMAQYLKRHKRMDVADALEVFRQLAEALARAHALNIVHRDIKPSNIMLIEGQHLKVKLVDFGIASLSSLDSLEQQSLTAPGVVLGTPLYMSPEQTRGQPVDKRADIYSLACSMFEALSGSPPYKGETGFATLLLHQDAPVPSLAERCPDLQIPADLDLTLQKMMAKEPSRRLQSMEQVAQACQRLLHGKSARPESTGHFASKVGIGHGPESEAVWWQSRKVVGGTICGVAGVLAIYAAVSYFCIQTSQRKSATSYKEGTFQTALPSGVMQPTKLKSFFKRLVKRDGVTYRVYEFPLDDVICKMSTRGDHVHTCIGTTEIPDNSDITLWMSGDGEQALSELACFVDDPVWGVHISDVDVNKLGQILSKFKRLGILKIANSKVGARELASLEQISTLKFLSLENCQLDQKALISSPLLDKMESLGLAKGSESVELYKTLQKKKQLTGLFLEKQNLSADSIAAIAGIKSIKKLDLMECDVDAALLAREFALLQKSNGPIQLRVFNKNWDTRDVRLISKQLPYAVVVSPYEADDEIKKEF